MTTDLEQLVQEVRDLTGADQPEVLQGDAPVLVADALSGDGDGFYLVGLIGGKDVGKSALVNALVGQEITERTSHGPGTEIAIAYAHEAQEPALRKLLDAQVPGRFRIVTHSIPRLYRQVLVDLPDIDSHYEDHVELTRRMLRHLLFPIWVQSIEKYADIQPQKLLSRVATGNAPENFIFCLNKIDQVIEREGPAAAKELREDFARRLARTLSLPKPPKVHLVSAIHPDLHDLPHLRDLLSQQKTGEAVLQSKQLAGRQQGLSVLSWFTQQDLPGRLRILERLHEDAEGMTADRIAAPLVQQSVPRLMDDPAYRATLVEECLRRRVYRWPVVNIVHSLISPLFAVVRQAVGSTAVAPFASTDAIVDAYLQPDGVPVSSSVQTTFAQLQQSHPILASLYRQRKLWESMSADRAAADLRRTLVGVLDKQRAALRSRFGADGLFTALGRFILTVGALLWFPLVQPLLEAVLQPGQASPELRVLLGRFVQILGVNYLLQNVTFLILYFVILWAILKWDTQRRVSRILFRWKSPDHPDASLNLFSQALQWTEGLLDEIHLARNRLNDLITQIDKLEKSLNTERASAA